MKNKVYRWVFPAVLSLLLSGCVVPHKAVVVNKSIPETTRNITLLLPLHGKLANESQAIHNGFLAAYYYDKQQTQADLNIKVTDVADGNIISIYQNAVGENPDVIVGPLTKPMVAAVSDLPITVPTIALNTLDNYSTKIVPNFYQFGLAPQDEALQAADRILADRHRQLVIMAPGNSWGQGLAKMFQHQYENGGGNVIVDAEYNDQDNFDQFTQKALDVVRTKIPDPTHKTSKVKLEITHRMDVDAIFLIAQPAITRQIVPLLRFYANDIPIYATSAIYSGTSNVILDQDINGVFFCDMPWVLKNPLELSSQLQAIRNQIIMLWPDFANYTKFYALGIDAYFLATSLGKLTRGEITTIDGATGKLRLDQFNHIYRSLDWQRMGSGVF